MGKTSFRNTNLKLLSLLVILGSISTFDTLDCQEGCLDCRSNGITTWCEYCHKKGHKFTSPIDKKCESTGAIENCASQITKYYISAEGVHTAIQHCQECDIGYAAVQDKSLDTTITTKICPKCLKLPEGITSADAETPDGGDGAITTVYSCVLGKYPVGSGCDDLPTDDPTVTQEEVQNCAGYNKAGCVFCKAGYEMVRTKLGSIKKQGRDYYEACLKIPEKLAGCRRAYTPNGGCEHCDFLLGYYAKQVLTDQDFNGRQTQICTNGKNVTEVEVI